MKFIIATILLAFTSASLATDSILEINGKKIWYSIDGNSKGVPLLVIHGGPGGSSCNYGALKSLRKNREVIFYDQAGAGHSEVTDKASWTTEYYAEELNQLIQALHKPKVHLFAHSWGAAVAARYLQRYGTENIASVIFASPYLSSQDWTKGTLALREELPLQTRVNMRKHENDKTTDSAEYQQAMNEFYGIYLFHKPHENPPECDAKSWNNEIYEYMWGNSEFVVQGTLKDFDATQVLASLKIPALFIAGEFDEVPEATLRSYQQKLPGSSLSIIPNAGHMTMVDEPTLFTRTLETFLERADKTQIRR